jgi:hypothetical protein
MRDQDTDADRDLIPEAPLKSTWAGCELVVIISQSFVTLL